ncbi:MAG TPA: acyl-CoA dehydrogenase [Baekduia sp.]|nr:acyl-CoA dehydrogenase [Baekduia sp.]
MTPATTEDRTASAALLLSARDLRFLLHEWLDLGALTQRPRYGDHTPETFDDVLALAERLAAERFAPHAARADREEPELDGDSVRLIPEIGEALAAHAAAGFIGISLDERVGGAQLPHLLETACACWFNAANVGTAVYHGLTTSAARLLLTCGSPEQVDTWVPPMVEGRFLATMCLSETEAGSSLADISTRAEPQEDGTYRLFGSKMWIGGGEHALGENIVHLVLAKLPDAPAGTAGISLFLVPKWLLDRDRGCGERNDVTVAGLNHKMGQRGTVNTLLGFGEGAHRPGGAAGAVGYLVGEPHRGLAAMFHMMNESRLAVGTAATAIGYTAYLRALQYARERVQGREPGAPAGAPPVPIIRHPDVRRMLLRQKSYVEGALALVLYAGRLLDDSLSAETEEQRARAHLLLSTLTSVVKSWPSQWGLCANDLAIQVHGGYGYARDYEVERLYRDNRVSSIYEGTHGIQALDLLGRQIFRNQGAGLRAVLEEIAATVQRARSAGGPAEELGAELEAVAGELETTTRSLAEAPDVALANATLFLEAFGHLVVAWLWLEQVLAAGDRHDDFYDGKRHTARFFFTHELPRVRAGLDLLAAGDRLALDTDEAWL